MESIETLYEKYAPAVLRFAAGLSGSLSRAEDIVSETFLRALVRAPQIRTETALAYLLAIARNVYLSQLRRSRPEVAIEDDLPSRNADPLDRVAVSDQLERVQRGIKDLPEGERAALLMRAAGDLSYEDIAAALGISVVAAKVRVHRARQRLATPPSPSSPNQSGETR